MNRKLPKSKRCIPLLTSNLTITAKALAMAVIVAVLLTAMAMITVLVIPLLLKSKRLPALRRMTIIWSKALQVAITVSRSTTSSRTRNSSRCTFNHSVRILILYPISLSRCLFQLHYSSDAVYTKLSPNNVESFFQIGGIHGRPHVDYAGATGFDDAGTWGGYCTHSTVLFPTWHRPYVMLLEVIIISAV